MSGVAPDSAGNKPVPRFAALGILLAVALLALPASLLLKKPAPPPLPTFGQLPAFSLLDQDGHPVTSATFAGRAYVANFFFTSCPTVCPVLMGKMRGLQDRTKGLGTSAVLVSFSVDPATDTPAVLATYSQQFKRDPARWTLVTGPTEEMQRTVVDGFKVMMGREARDGGDGFDVVHGEHFVLVDQQGRLRGYYPADQIDRLVDDLTRLARPGNS